MKHIVHLTLVACVITLLNITPSWGGPPNTTDSDENQNTAAGMGALGNALLGDDGAFNNAALGFGALNSNTSGRSNTATGSRALGNNTLGSNNAATGQQALFSNTTGGENTATGSTSLLKNTLGNFNTAVGSRSLENNRAGSRNTAVGSGTLFHSTGSNNIAIGDLAGTALMNGSNNIYLGNNEANSNESQTMRLGSVQGSGPTTSTFIAGITTATVGDAAVMINSTTGQLGILTSSARSKRDIASMANRSEGVLQLRPVTFAYKEDAKGITHYGLIAEEVAAVYPELVTHTATGGVQTVKYHELIPMLLNELQRQQQTLERQQRELAELRALVGSRLEK